MQKFALFFLFLLTLSLLYNDSPAQIHISGPLNGILPDTTYIVDSTIVVEEGAILTIMPGAEFLFESGDFDVRGYLFASGTADDSIIFKRNDGSSGWGGIDFYETGTNSNLQYCVITGSIASGLDFFNSDPNIFYCTIKDNQAGSTGGGIFSSSSNAYMLECVIADNYASMGGNIMVTGGGSMPVFENCIITGGNAYYYGGGIACFSGNPEFYYCDITGNLVTNNSTTGYGGAFYLAGADPIIQECFIFDNVAGLDNPGLGGGIYCTNAHPQIKNCIIRGNSVGVNSAGDGGGINLMNSNPTITGCLILQNYSDNMGGGIFMEYSEPVIENCSLIQNECYFEGGAIFVNYGALTMKNSLIDGTHGIGAVYFNSAGDHEITYNNLYNRWCDNFAGEVPDELGIESGFNTKGDLCDDFNNIFLDPQFHDPGNNNYHLKGNSPCIDAGDPTSPLDPDNTISDIGCYYFEQGGYPELSLMLTPSSPPIIIPSGGGQFDYVVEVTNNELNPLGFDYWTTVVILNTQDYIQLINFQDLNIASWFTASREKTQIVPGNAPEGQYIYKSCVGQYPDQIWYFDLFGFEKESE